MVEFKIIFEPICEFFLFIIVTTIYWILSMYQALYCIILLNFHISHLGVICIHTQTLRLTAKHLPKVTVLIRGKISDFRDYKLFQKARPLRKAFFCNPQEYTGQTVYWILRKRCSAISFVSEYFFFALSLFSTLLWSLGASPSCSSCAGYSCP